MTVLETKKVDYKDIIVFVSTIVGAIFGSFLIWFILAFSFDGYFPFVYDLRSAFNTVLIIGTIMCASIFPIRASISKKFRWLSPFTLISIFLGCAITIFVILYLTGVLYSLPPVPINDAVAVVILLSSIMLKWILATVSLFVQKQ